MIEYVNRDAFLWTQLFAELKKSTRLELIKQTYPSLLQHPHLPT